MLDPHPEECRKGGWYTAAIELHLYETLLEMYDEIKITYTLNPFTIMDLNRHTYQISEAWPEGKFKTLLKNAMSNVYIPTHFRNAAAQ